MILIKINRDSLRRMMQKNGSEYFYQFDWVPVTCAQCQSSVEIAQIDYDPGYSVCPACGAKGSFEDVVLETREAALADLESSEPGNK